MEIVGLRWERRDFVGGVGIGWELDGTASLFVGLESRRIGIGGLTHGSGVGIGLWGGAAIGREEKSHDFFARLDARSRDFSAFDGLVLDGGKIAPWRRLAECLDVVEHLLVGVFVVNGEDASTFERRVVFRRCIVDVFAEELGEIAARFVGAIDFTLRSVAAPSEVFGEFAGELFGVILWGIPRHRAIHAKTIARFLGY